MKWIAVALGVFLLAIALWFAGMVFWYSSAPEHPGSTGDTDVSGQAETGQKQQLEQQVLQGFEVVNQGGGNPIVRYYDPGAMEYGTQPITQALFAQAMYGSDMADMGAEVPYDPGVAGYKLGLVYEHGLFNQSVNPGDAARYYRIARVYGHAEGDKAASRLEAAGH